MKKKKNAVQVKLEYYLARLAAGVFKYLPLVIAVRLGKFLGHLFYTFDKRHREQCVLAMQKALQLNKEDGENLTRAMYRHFGTMLAEFPRIPLQPKDFFSRQIDWGDAHERIKKLLAQGKGIIFVTGHIGNWEVCGTAFKVMGYSRAAIVRPLDNYLIDAWVRSVRESHGQEVWDKFGAVRQALRALKQGDAFGILVDIDGGQDGVFNTFFGQCCSTVSTPVDLALRTGAPLVVAAFQRLEPMRFKLEMGNIFYANPETESEQERKRLLQCCNDELEKIIRKCPEQWLWLHRRWKTQPKEKEKND